VIKRIKPIVFYTILFLFILVVCLQSYNFDYDLWARLIVGQHVIQTGHVLKLDFLSYTPTHIWYDHEWLSGTIFYIILHIFGGTGLIVLQSILIFSTFFVITKIIKLRGVKTTTPYNFLFYFFSICSISYLLKLPIRCHLFSFLFFAIFLYILELSRRDISEFKIHKFSPAGEWGLVIYLPILMIFWNNLHGGCVSGIGLIALYALGEFLNKKPTKMYVYTLIATILVLPLNPWGFKYLGFLFSASTMSRPDIVEWWGIFCKYNIHKYIYLKIFGAMLILTELGFAIKSIISKNYNFDKTKFLVLSATLYVGIMHQKLVPLFVISAMAFLYDDFYTALNTLTFNILNKIGVFKDSMVYILISIYIIGNVLTHQITPQIQIAQYPYLSVEFLKTNKIKGNLLTNFGAGSYAAYKLYPDNKIFMDGRYEEVYYQNMIPLLKQFHLVKSNWDEILKKYPPDIMIIEKYYPIYNHLKYSDDWTLIFDKDTNFGIFIKSKYAKTHYKNPPLNIDYYKRTLFDTSINFAQKPIAK